MDTWRFDSLPIAATGARIGLCPCPGRGGALADHLDRLHAWGARGLVTLLEDRELVALGVQAMAGEVEARGMRWWHLPIRDMHAPDAGFEARWRAVGPSLRCLLGAGQAVALHCHGGLGRTGTVAARLLVDSGETPAAAIARVRATRPGSIETAEQKEYVLGLRVGG